LYANNIGDEGATALAQVLSSGQAPQGLTLYLYANNIGDEGATALAQALSSGQAPQCLTLILAGNKIGHEGATALAQALFLILSKKSILNSKYGVNKYSKMEWKR
jgi:hypothetical protein